MADPDGHRNHHGLGKNGRRKFSEALQANHGALSLLQDLEHGAGKAGAQTLGGCRVFWPQRRFAGRSASEVWWQLQFDLERLVHSEVIAGVSFDLPKLSAHCRGRQFLHWGYGQAFPPSSYLRGPSQSPVAAEGFRSGVPWAHHYSAAVLVDLALHCHVSSSVPSACVTTFVDDWKTKAGNAGAPGGGEICSSMGPDP